jgi:DNA-binding MarR family transcriptional regulator
MEQVQALRRMAGKTAPGRTPDFTASHLLYALSLLRERRIGRKQLAETLRVGEGTVRTILSRLSDGELIEISRPGVTLSTAGAAFLESLETRLMWDEFPPTDLTVSECNLFVLVRQASGRVRYGVEQRDQALIHGAVGATTLVRSNGLWILPGTGEEVALDFAGKGINPEDGDVVVIGTGVDAFTAALGAFSAAIHLVS